MSDPCHVLIIGGGLAGFGTGIALKRAGHNVTIFERSPVLQEIGAGIQLSPNATRILRSWDVLDNVLAHAYQPSSGGFRSWNSGKWLKSVLPPSDEILERHGAPYIVVHRANLLDALVAAATARGVTVRLGCSVWDVDLGQDTAVVLSGGERVYGDVILGADGERSFCRSMLLGRLDPPVPTGDRVFRIAVSRSDIAGDKSHPSWYIAQPGSVNVWMGPDSHVVSYSLNNNDIINVVLIRRAGETPSEKDEVLGPQPASLEELRREFEGWDPALRALLDVPGKTHCARWNQSRINKLESWRQRLGGAFCLIGDAAHAMPPYLAQGAVQAFEDAAVLGAVFARVSRNKEQILKALEVFEAVRKPRTERVLEHTLSRKVMFGLHDGPEQQERDDKLAKGAGEECPDELAQPGFQDWLWGYDAEREASQAWESRV